ncbi:MAG: hypothetical protein MHM6MM_003341 [Cercozoa sp. M6MM]
MFRRKKHKAEQEQQQHLNPPPQVIPVQEGQNVQLPQQQQQQQQDTEESSKSEETYDSPVDALHAALKKVVFGTNTVGMEKLSLQIESPVLQLNVDDYVYDTLSVRKPLNVQESEARLADEGLLPLNATAWPSGRRLSDAYRTVLHSVAPRKLTDERATRLQQARQWLSDLAELPSTLPESQIPMTRLEAYTLYRNRYHAARESRLSGETTTAEAEEEAFRQWTVYGNRRETETMLHMCESISCSSLLEAKSILRFVSIPTVDSAAQFMPVTMTPSDWALYLEDKQKRITRARTLQTWLHMLRQQRKAQVKRLISFVDITREMAEQCLQRDAQALQNVSSKLARVTMNIDVQAEKEIERAARPPLLGSAGPGTTTQGPKMEKKAADTVILQALRATLRATHHMEFVISLNEIIKACEYLDEHKDVFWHDLVPIMHLELFQENFVEGREMDETMYENLRVVMQEEQMRNSVVQSTVKRMERILNVKVAARALEYASDEIREAFVAVKTRMAEIINEMAKVEQAWAEHLNRLRQYFNKTAEWQQVQFTLSNISVSDANNTNSGANNIVNNNPRNSYGNYQFAPDLAGNLPRQHTFRFPAPAAMSGGFNPPPALPFFNAPPGYRASYAPLITPPPPVHELPPVVQNIQKLKITVQMEVMRVDISRSWFDVSLLDTIANGLRVDTLTDDLRDAYLRKQLERGHDSGEDGDSAAEWLLQQLDTIHHDPQEEDDGAEYEVLQQQLVLAAGDATELQVLRSLSIEPLLSTYKVALLVARNVSYDVQTDEQDIDIRSCLDRVKEGDTHLSSLFSLRNSDYERHSDQKYTVRIKGAHVLGWLSQAMPRIVHLPVRLRRMFLQQSILTQQQQKQHQTSQNEYSRSDSNFN